MIEILIGTKENNKKIALIENGNLVEYYEQEQNSNRTEGNLYVGIVKDLIKGMQAAFVDIGTEKNGFIHLKDLLPKVDETKEEVKNNININEVIKLNQKILVQVKKDSNIQKGARVSTHINLPGRYIVLMPNTNIITISQKIEDKKEQERLIKLVKENITPGNGAVIRTSAEKKEKEIIEDIKIAEKKYEKDKGNKPKLIEKAEDVVEKMILDIPEEKIDKIIVDSKKEYENIKNKNEETGYLGKIKLELEEENIFEKYDIQKQIDKIDNRKIWLRCGGFITIDKTEALTAIDVNTGKYTGNKNAEETIYKVNEEATAEIAKQIRLRNIGGIIIIDYIDMPNIENKKRIQKLLEEKLKADRTKTQVEGFTKLDLMEMTRKHI